MPNYLINVKTKGAKEATKSVGKLKQGLGKLTSIGMMGAVGGALALGKSFSVLTKAAAEQERVETKLYGAIGSSAKALIEQAGALQQTSKYGDEAIIAQQAYLASIGMTEEQIRKTVAVSVDLAAATGMSLESAVKNASKTLSGMTGELGESVPALRELTAEELKAGKGIEVMGKMFKGMAETEIKTFDGAMTQAKNALGDTAEALGSFLLPMAKGGAGLIKKFAEGTSNALKSFGEIKWGDTIKNVVKNLSVLPDMFLKILGLALSMIPDQVKHFMTNTLPVIIEKATEWGTYIWDTIKSFATYVFEPLIVAGKMAWETIKFSFNMAWVGIQNLGIGMLNFFKTTWASISGGAEIGFLMVGQAVEQMFAGLKNMGVSAINFLLGQYNKLAESTVGKWAGFEPVKLLKEVDQTEIANEYDTAINAVKDKMDAVEITPKIKTDALKSEYKEKMGELGTEFMETERVKDMTGLYSAMMADDDVTNMKSFSEKAGEILAGYKDLVVEKKDEAESEGISLLPGGLTQADIDKQDELRALNAEKKAEEAEKQKEIDAMLLQSGMASIADLEAARKAEASNFVSNLATMAQAFPEAEKASKRAAQVQAIVDTYASANAAYKAMVGIPVVGPALAIGAAGAAIGAGLANVKQIEKAQFGMDKIISDPTLIMAGEGSQPESVNITPLNADTGGGLGGGGTTISLSGNVMSEQFVEDELAEKIAEATRRGTSFA